MYTLALQVHKNSTKLILYSLYALLLSFLVAPPRYYSPPNNILSFANASTIQYGHITKESFRDKASEEIYNQNLMIAEKERWDESIKQRYTNGAILTVTSGVKHIKLTKRTNSGNVRVNIIEMNKKLNPDLEILPVLASDTLANKANIRTMAKKENALVAINATYFKPQNGIPLGTLMIDKKIYTGPIYNRVALGIKPDGYIMDKYQLDAKLKYGKNELKIDNINQPRMLSTYVLAYTKDWGEKSPSAPKLGINIAIANGEIIEIATSSIKIPDNGYVISGPKQKLDLLIQAQEKNEKQIFIASLINQKKIELEIKNNEEWNEVNHIISGGPYLIKNGEVFIDVTEQKLQAITGRNPRTAIGYTENDEFIMVTIDGREHSSVGMTLSETAKMMKDFGCIWAMNLDGGGSSVMYVKDKVVNNPSIKGGIAISNALIIKES